MSEEWVRLDDFENILLPKVPENGAEPLSAFRFEIRTAIEIEAEPDPPETDKLLGPLITKGERTILVGDTGHGKTSLGLQMIRAVLTGDELLGHEGAGIGPAMIVDLEQGRRAIKRGLRETQLHTRHDVLHISVPDGLALDKDQQHIAALDAALAEHVPAILLLDPYYKAHRADDPNQERPIIDLMRLLDSMRVTYGFALLLPAHPRKEIAGKEGARKLTINDIAGSGAITRGAEIILGLERLAHGFARLRYLKDREGELPVNESINLLYDKEQGFRLDPRDQETDEAIETRILETSHDWMTTEEWRQELNIRKATAAGILGAMAASGRIAHMIGPPGRSKRAHCYGTSPKAWEQSGLLGTVSLIPVESVTSPTSPPPVGGTRSGSSRTTDEPEPGNSTESELEDYPAHPEDAGHSQDPPPPDETLAPEEP